MTGLLTRISLLSFLMVVPVTSWAQPAEETPAEETAKPAEEKKDEAKAEEKKDEPTEEKKDEAKPEATKTEAAKPEEAKTEAKPEEPKQPGPTASEPTTTEVSTTTNETTVSSGSSAGVATTEAETEEETKPWTVSAVLSQSLGAGAFVSNTEARTPSYGYAVTLRGYYKFHELAKAFARIDFNQQLSKTSIDLGTEPQEFYFQDIRLGATAAKLYKEEKITDISFGAAADIRLPTSKAAQSLGRVLAVNLSGVARRTFEGLGPGDLTLTYQFGFRKDFGPRSKVIDSDDSATIAASCRGSNHTDSGDCMLSSYGSMNFRILNSFSVEYTFLEDFTASLGLVIYNSFHYNVATETPDTLSGSVRSSEDAGFTDQRDLVSGVVEIAYAINDNWALAFGLSTLSDPFIQSDNNQYALRFPWWDLDSFADNRSSLYLDATFTY